MRARKLALPLLPGIALGAAALLVNPGAEVQGFSLNGDSLNPGQRDFRLYNTFADAQANNNTTPDPMFPGWDGAEMAMWKGVIEWSNVHGDGSGDPSQPILGSGGADFDSAWMGNAAAIGSSDDNVISPIGACTQGVFAFAEGPYSNGWRVRFCDDQWTWADGPASVGSRADMQGIMTHEYGHCLGLNHTNATSAATMWASTSLGALSPRSIHADDIAGLKAIYGVRTSDKVTICQTSVSGSTLTISGAYFDPLDNDVWFCPTAVTLANNDPRIRVLGVSSTSNGTQITVTIPAGVAAGDVLVKRPDSGGQSLSNPFPMNLTGTIGVACSYAVTSITPSTIDALAPGTAQSVILGGIDMDDTVQIDVNGNVVSPSRWTIVNASEITIDMPQALLGANTLTVSDGDASYSIPFTTVEPSSPKLELGTGDPTYTVANGGTMNMIVSGQVGSIHRIYYSPSSVPSVFGKGTFDMGNNFTQFFFGALFSIGAEGYTEFSAPISFGGGSPMTFYSQSIDVTTPPSPNYGISNLQTITLTP